jgi:hypothetical protein
MSVFIRENDMPRTATGKVRQRMPKDRRAQRQPASPTSFETRRFATLLRMRCLE